MLTQDLTSHSNSGARLFLKIGLGLALLLLPASFAIAQVTGSATLRGLVKDPSGAVVPKASVTLTNNATTFERKAKTTEEGVYNFSSIDPGTYTLKVEAQGFKTYEQTGIIVSASDTKGVDAVMEVGAANEVVTIQASVEVIQKETGAKENTITSKTIDNTSIISRSALELLRILPGVVAPDETTIQSVTFGGGANANNSYNVNGLRGENNNISIDGSRIMDIGSNNGTIITANADMVQEVKVQTSNYSAEYGSSGVQITATTKNGSSGFHGEVYDYIRNYRFNANDRSNTLFGLPRSQDSYQYPGGNIGGPVLIPGTGFNKNRDKLFFFFGYEVQRQQVQLNTVLDRTPTLAERAGTFCKNGAATCDSSQQIHFDPTQFPIGKVFLNQYPLPNFTDPNPNDSPLLNYANQGLQPTNRTQMVGRVDYNITPNTKLYVRLAREAETQDFARGLWWNPSNYELPSHVQGQDLGRSMSASLVRVINPTLTNEVVVSASKLLLNNDYADPSKVSISSLGIGNYATPFGQQSKYVPLAFITSWGGQTHGDLWSPGGNPLFSHNSSFSVTDNATKVKGAHTIKFGTLIEQADKIQNFNTDTEGRFIFANWGNHSTGNEFADILTGRPTQVVAGTKTPIGNFRLHNFEFYLQDSWKVRPNLTLEFGVRADYYPNNYEQGGQGIIFDPGSYVQGQGILVNNDPTKPNGILTAKSGAIPKGLVSTPGIQWAPRLNFAWDINGRGDTVVRGGAGIFYNRVQGNYQYYSLQQPPNSFSETFDSYQFGGLGNNTGLTYNTMTQINPFAQLGSIGISTADQHSIFIPRTANMSLSIARRLPTNTVLEVAYVGTEGRHLPDTINTDFIPVGTLLSGHVGNANLAIPVQRWAVAGQAGVLANFRPFPAYSNINLLQYDSTSSYHSLQVTASHQQGKNLQFFATYTFSKALGTTATNETGSQVDPIDTRHRSWGVLPYDRTHIFNLSYNYNLPSLARGAFDNKFTRGVFSGWQMSGITTFQSGIPIKLVFGGDLGGANAALAFFGSDAFSNSVFASGPVAPIFSKNPQLSGNKLGDRILDLNAIQIPPLGSTGAQVNPFYLRSPHRWNHDVSFFKNFRITESKRIQFRAGFFNIFNQAYPGFGSGNSNQNDVNTQLIVDCNVKLNGVPNGTGGTSDNVCDPTQGFHYDPTTVANFGKIINKHGHRIVELALKFYF